MDTTARPTSTWSPLQALRDTLYLLLGWPLLLAGLVVVLTLLGCGVPLAIFWIGIPLALAGLGVAHLVAEVEREVQRVLLHRELPVAPAATAPSDPRWRLWGALKDPQRLGEVALALVGWLPASLMWALTISWWSATVAFLAAPWLVRRADGPLGFDVQRGTDLATVLHLPDVPWVHDATNVVVGLGLLLLLPWVMRALAGLQSGINAALLDLPGGRASAAEREHRRRLAAAQSAESTALRRLERDIHDGPQQRIVRLQLDLARAERAIDDPDKARGIITGARQQAQGALDELRATTRGIAPQVLVERGLGAACEEIAGRCPLPMRVDIDLPRLAPATETALYYLVSEATTNAVKHSGARAVRVVGRVEQDRAVVRITDDGRGGAHPAKGTGLAGLEHRLAAVGGTLTVTSPVGGPTTIEGSLPCAS